MIPYVQDKFDSPSINKPGSLVDKEDIQCDIPSTVILLYQSEFYEEVVKAREDTDSYEVSRGELTVFERSDIGVFSDFQIGAPMTVSEVEKLVYLGVDTLVNLGWAGGLDDDHGPGSVVLSTRAIRDEGASYHYLPDGEEATPSEELFGELEGGLNTSDVSYDKGVTWTTDAPQRETVRELNVMREEGVLAVDMELSAVFAVAAYRDVDAAGLFCISDVLRHDSWEQHFEHEQTRKTMKTVFNTVLGVLSD